MKYWLLTSEYPPFFGGGISTYCYHTANMLAEKGHQVSVFVNDPSVNGIKESSTNYIRIVRFAATETNAAECLGHTTAISYEFAHIVKCFIEKEGKPDIIEAQEYLGIAYYLLQYKYLLYDWCADIPVVITMHSPSFLYMEYNHVPEYRYPNFWICEMERFCLQAADHVISPSQYMIDELEKRFPLHHKNVTVVANPYHFQQPEMQSTGSATEIIFYGKLTAQKGAFQLLSYCKTLWENGWNRTLHLIGGQDIVYHPEGISMGDLVKKKYKKYIETGLLQLEDRIKPSDIAVRLAKAEVVIVPSNNDNLPYVVAEMMSLGKIVLASRQGGHREVIQEGINGFLFDHEKPETFPAQLSAILNLTQEEKALISKKAIERIRNYFGYEEVYAKKTLVSEKVLPNKKTCSTQFPFMRHLPTSSIKAQTAENNKLSVVIPYYNLGRYLDETIQSVRQSNYKNKEIIIVNDGSKNKQSLDKLNAYRNSADIKIIDCKNAGVAQARNNGAQFATGSFIAFLDADDMVAPDYFSKAIDVLKHYSNVHFAGCWTQYFGNSKAIWPAFSPEPPLILYHNLVNSSSLVYKRDSFLTAGLNDTSMTFQGLEDYESVLSMIASGLNGVAIPETLFKYRVRPDSMIRGVSRTKKLLLYQHISRKHHTLYATFAAKVFNLLNANGPGLYLDNPTLDHHLADKIPLGGKTAQKIIRLVKRNRHARKIAYKLYRFLKK